MRDHRLHALCPYFAMFPPLFAREAILRHSGSRDLILDPFSGRGTTLLEALLLGRRVLASDINPVAYCISAAKARVPSLGRVLALLERLEAKFSRRRSVARGVDLPNFFSAAFQPETLSQILFLRANLQWKRNAVDRFVAALVLAQLHGEMDHSPNFFSNQMPHTISTKPQYSIDYWDRHELKPPRRDVFKILKEKARFRLVGGPQARGDARVSWTDVRAVNKRFEAESGRVSVVITSPPYLDVTAFEEDQWLRLWFLGGPPNPTFGVVSNDDRHRSNERYWQFLTEAWSSVSDLLKPRATLVFRIGSRRLSRDELESGLRATLLRTWSKVNLVQRPVITRLRNSRATLMDAKAKGCRFEIDVVYRVAS